MNSIIVEHLAKRYRLGGKRSKRPNGSGWFEEMLQMVGLGWSDKRVAREKWALKDVSFDVEPGQILGIIGPNGAGKTTLLKILARITPPTEGRAIGRGRVVSLLEVGFGFHPNLSGRENIFLNAAIYGIPRSHVLKKFDQIVDFADVREYIDAPLRFYSSGMYLRLAFSVAVNIEPDILLADEVLAVGDLNFQERCLQRVQEAGEAGMTVLFVSHDMAAITRLCHRVIWLNAGQIVKSGHPEEVVAQYQSSAWTMNIGRIKKGSHANQYGEILSTSLRSAEGKEIGAARVSEDVFVKVAFHILERGVSVRCAFDIYTHGIHAFRSVQPQEFQIPIAGIYTASARIPANFLAETIYTCNVSVTVIRDGEEHPLVEYNALSFQVYDTDQHLRAQGIYKGPAAGVVMPRLEWNVVPE